MTDKPLRRNLILPWVEDNLIEQLLESDRSVWIFFDIRNHASSIRDRFGPILRRTWRCLRTDVRNTIWQHWEQLGNGAPHITVTDDFGLLHDDWLASFPDNTVGGLCINQGATLGFFAPTIDYADETQVQHIIAHELFHVWRFATGADTDDLDSEEREVDKLILEYGFSSGTYDVAGLRAALGPYINAMDGNVNGS